MPYEALIGLLDALCVVNQRSEIPTGDVRVKYRGDETVYLERAPVRRTDIKEDGLLDPGFGSGPVRYEDIDYVKIQLDDWVRELSIHGERAFILLGEKVGGIHGLSASQDTIAWRRQ